MNTISKALLLTALVCGAGPVAAETEAEAADARGAYLRLHTERVNGAEVRAESIGNLLQDLPARAGAKGILAFELGPDGVRQMHSAGTLDPDTPVVLASPTKIVTAAVILSLVDDGTLDLAKPISTYLPDLKGPARDVTLHQLLSHTAGVGMPGGDRDHAKLLTEFDPHADFGVVAQTIAAAPLLFEPGRYFRYDGHGVQLAGYVATRVTGKDWPTLFAERIAKPVGMTHSWYAANDRGGLAPDQVSNPNIAGGLNASAADMAAFLAMVLNQGRSRDGTPVLKPETAALLGAVQTKGIEPAPDSPHFASLADGYGYGGWCVATVRPQCEVQMLAGSYGTVFFIDWRSRRASLAVIEGEKTEPSISLAYFLTFQGRAPASEPQQDQGQ